MKKISMFIIGMLFVMMISFSSCNGCGKKTVEPSVDTTTVEEVAPLVVENVTGTDRQYMFTNYSGDYLWFESCIVLKDFLDEECDGTVTGISNVFQVVEEKDNGADVYVILAAHTADSTAYEVKHAFWVEDMPMNNEDIKVTFAEAFEKINEVNFPKPHSRHCVLRKQVGPVDANPQYIFGNTHAQLYVDAVTGEVSEDNPAFPEAQGFKMPLGEWP